MTGFWGIILRLCGDKILDVLRWMRAHSADMDLEGLMFRGVIVAVREFLGDDEIGEE